MGAEPGGRGGMKMRDVTINLSFDGCSGGSQRFATIAAVAATCGGRWQ
jgi:hypothetical protein